MHLRNILLLCAQFVTILASEETTENPEKAKEGKSSTKPLKEKAKQNAKKLGKKAFGAFNLKYQKKPEGEKQQAKK